MAFSNINAYQTITLIVAYKLHTESHWPTIVNEMNEVLEESHRLMLNGGDLGQDEQLKAIPVLALRKRMLRIKGKDTSNVGGISNKM